MLNHSYHDNEEPNDLDFQEDERFTTDIIRLYLNGIDKYPLLSPEDEIKLGKIIQENESQIIRLQNDLDAIEACVRERGIPTVRERSRITKLRQIITQYPDMPVRLERSRIALSVFKKTSSNTKSDARRIRTFCQRINFMQGKCRVLLSAQEKLKILEQSIAQRGLPTRTERENIGCRNRALEELRSKPQRLKAERGLIHGNLRFVVSIAKEPQYSRIRLLDRIQAGNLGLMKAVTKFDPERGYRFATYASFWIRKAISDEIRNQCRTIRLTEWVIEEMAEVEKIIKMLIKQFGRDPTPDEVVEAIAERDARAPKMNVAQRHSSATQNPPEAMVDRYRCLRRLDTTLPLDHPIRDGDRRNQIDTIEDRRCLEDGPIGVISRKEREALITRLLSRLKPLEQRVLEALYFENLDGQECADICGISREWVRRIHTEALNTLRMAITRNVRKMSEIAGMRLSAEDIL